jgi:GH35 family endo-1,4-beta-xylanase
MRKSMKILFYVSAIMFLGSKARCTDYSGSDIEGIESIVADINDPNEGWRIDANLRIDAVRKADMEILVVDEQSGLGVADMELDVQLIRHQFQFGGIVDAIRLNGAHASVSEEFYKETFLNMGFNVAGFNNALKPKITGQHRYLPASFAWFESHQIPVHGGTLFRGGYSNLSATVRAAFDLYASDPTEQNRQNLADTIEIEIRDWTSRWDVIDWGVLNEPRGKHDIMDILGNEAIIGWFHFAEESKVNPDAVLYLNENRIISDTADGILTDKINTYMNTVDYLLDNNAPLTGFGLQSRYGSMLSADTIYQRLQLFEVYGLPIYATECEMKSSIATELEKAQMTERVMTVYFSHYLVDAIYCWTIFPNRNNPGLRREILDINGVPNLRGKVWLYLLKNHWMTDETLVTDQTGRAALRGFKGDYSVTISFPDGRQESVAISLDQDASYQISLNGNGQQPGVVKKITVESQVSASQDDGYASSDQLQSLDGDTLKVGSSALSQPPYHVSGMVFTNLDIPQGAEITSARLKVRSHNSGLTETAHCVIEAEATDHAASFDSSRHIGSLLTTGTSVDWILQAPWSADTWYESPDIAGVIQEVIDRPDWSAGNSLAILCRSIDEGGYRDISSFDRDNDSAPMLEIIYRSE